MIDIVTVVFQEEIPILKVQAESVARYCQNIGIRNIYVVVNDDKDTIHKIDAGWWGDLANHVLVVPRSAFSTQFIDNGWVSQQALKLLAAAMSHNTWSMVLDAKTVFVRELQLTDLLDCDGRARVGTLPVFPVFEPTRLMINELYNIDMKDQLGPGGVPFFFQNDVVRLMIAETTFLAKKSFPIWFQAKGRITEFMLYSGYLQYRFGGYDTFYSSDSAFGAVNISHGEVDQFNTKLKQMQDPRTLTVSIHRGAWSQLSADQRQEYQFRLIDAGLIGAHGL
jgi:hypothetical protein